MLEQTAHLPILGKPSGFPRSDNVSYLCYAPAPPAKGSVNGLSLSMMWPDLSPLPKLRMCSVMPFTVMDIDFTGALYVQTNGADNKVYISLFMCITTGAVHLGIATDLTSETFLLVLRRFASHKSLPQIIASDNGSTCLSAVEELKELLSSKNLMQFLNGQGNRMEIHTKMCPLIQ